MSLRLDHPLTEQDLKPPNSKIVVEKVGIERFQITLPPAGIKDSNIFHVLGVAFFLFGSITLTLKPWLEFHSDTTMEMVISSFIVFLFWAKTFLLFKSAIVRVNRSHVFKIERSKLILIKNDFLSKIELEIPFEEIRQIRRKKIELRANYFRRLKMHWNGQAGFYTEHDIPFITYKNQKESFCEGYSSANQKWLVRLLNKILYNVIAENNRYQPERYSSKR